jgi:hypothetical protein
MKMQLTKNGRKWSLYTAVVVAMGYAALTLNSEPAYAGACTATFCEMSEDLVADCTELCAPYFGYAYYICDYPPPNNWTCECKDGHRFTENCP